jgi:diguanylate cyclase (GGDEF)-like protein
MARDAAEVISSRYRRPWYWLLVIAAAASFVTWLIVTDARNRIAERQRQFETTQQSKLQRMEQRIDDYFVDAIQLASAGSEMLGPAPVSRDALRNVVVQLYRSRIDHRTSPVFGLGAFYAPFEFDPKARLYEAYVHAPPPGQRVSPFDVPLDPKTLLIIGPVPSGPVDYTRFRWYQRAVGAPGVTMFSGPYAEDGLSLISTIKAFYRSGRLIGVMAVDTLTSSFTAAMESVLDRGDIASIENSLRGRTLLSTGTAPPGAPRIMRTMELRYPGGFLHLSTDATPLLAEIDHIVSGDIAFAAMIWVFAIVLGVLMVRGWRSREANLALELQRSRLENEVVLGKKIQGELRKAAYTDLLTSLPNRAGFLERASEAMAQVAAGTARHAVFFIDLDRFNMINDTLGHFAGDELLKMIATRLRFEMPREALVARLGGDEFLILTDISSGDPGVFADQILASLKEPMLLGGRAVHTAASIGVVLLNDEVSSDPEAVLRDADIAMYAAKLRGRGCYAIFDAEMRRKVSADSDLDSDLRNAIERHEFVPYYQPIVSIQTREVISFEALVRWNRPQRGIVGAADFIVFAESRGLVDAIDSSMLDDVCGDAAALFERFPNATVAVNISAGHLTAPGLAGSVQRSLSDRKVAPERIRLEITETAIMSNAALARATLDQLRTNGMQIVLDDFGAGHSSLAYLHRLPIAGLKIDRSFIEPLATDPQAVAIVRSIVALAKTLGLYTVAEGVETAEQLGILEELGVPYAQGFFFSPAVALAALLQNGTRSAVS